jgi:hypothetical protein
MQQKDGAVLDRVQVSSANAPHSCNQTAPCVGDMIKSILTVPGKQQVPVKKMSSLSLKSVHVFFSS